MPEPRKPALTLDTSRGGKMAPPALAALQPEAPPPIDRKTIARRVLDVLSDDEWREVREEQNANRGC